jgi:formamidopyrimidine-DNA glycosylase
VSDYEQVTGEKGTMQTALKVYGRRGQPCGYCGAPLSYLKVGGRGTVYCPHCQP